MWDIIKQEHSQSMGLFVVTCTEKAITLKIRNTLRYPR